jgi:hypothetical protein
MPSRSLAGIGALVGLLALSVSSILAQTADWSKAHPDTVINYITWDGTYWTAKIQNGQFLHASHGDFTSPQTHPDSILNYKTWDGSNWTARLSGTVFIHAPNGDFSKAHTDSIMNYITWDGTLWTAKVQPDSSFLHAPVQQYEQTQTISNEPTSPGGTSLPVTQPQAAAQNADVTRLANLIDGYEFTYSNDEGAGWIPFTVSYRASVNSCGVDIDSKETGGGSWSDYVSRKSYFIGPLIENVNQLSVQQIVTPGRQNVWAIRGLSSFSPGNFSFGPDGEFQARKVLQAIKDVAANCR